MKKLALVCLVLAASAALADEKPDYTREGLRRTFSATVIELGPKPKPRFQVKFGYVEFRALGMDWRIMFLPVAPLSGTRLDVTQEPPDPFELTGVTVNQAPVEEVQMTAELKAELRRLKRVTR